MVVNVLIGIISDTHDHVSNTLKAIELFISKNIEYVIHLGDIISPFIPRFIKKRLDESEYKLTLYAVLGNNDGDVYLLHKLFNEYNWKLYSNPTILGIDNRKFYVMHGFNGIDFTERMALIMAEKMDVDGVLYGHTHKRRLEYVNEKIVLNPGEACGYLTGEPTIALLDTEKMKAEFISIK